MKQRTRPPTKTKQDSAETALIMWRSYLTGDTSQLDRLSMAVRTFFKRLPADRRCRVCNAPFTGVASLIARILGFKAGRSAYNPMMCDRCEILVKRHQVGTEVELTLLFLDVRGSTSLAEEIGVSDYHHLINRFFVATTNVLVESNALIDKLVEDEVIGLYLPGIAGQDHARVAIDAALDMLRATGHGTPDGPWISVGGGVHTGIAYVGAVGSSNSVNDITVLGDAANTAARLASQASGGEILVSESTYQAAGLGGKACDTRLMQLKGRNQPVTVRVMRVAE